VGVDVVIHRPGGALHRRTVDVGVDPLVRGGGGDHAPMRAGAFWLL